MSELGGRILCAGLAGAVGFAAVDEVKVPPASAFDAVAQLVTGTAATSASVSQGVHILVTPPEIVVVDQTNGARRIGPPWLAKQLIDDRSKEQLHTTGTLTISLA
jgi:hypothetical protein